MAVPSKYIQSVVKAAKGRPKSTDWYRDKIREFGTPKTLDLIRDGKQAARPFFGRLNMFIYDPKLKKKLPYYDTFPLVMYLKSAEGGFYGLNFHYLPYALRARLLDAAGQDNLSVSAVEGNSLTRPTIKRYLYGFARSMFRKIDNEDNLTAIMLPVQRFKKASDTQVWSDSRKML